jgi:hypothetical protein
MLGFRPLAERSADLAVLGRSHQPVCIDRDHVPGAPRTGDLSTMRRGAALSSLGDLAPGLKRPLDWGPVLEEVPDDVDSNSSATVQPLRSESIYHDDSGEMNCDTEKHRLEPLEYRDAHDGREILVLDRGVSLVKTSLEGDQLSQRSLSPPEVTTERRARRRVAMLGLQLIGNIARSTACDILESVRIGYIPNELSDIMYRLELREVSDLLDVVEAILTW